MKKLIIPLLIISLFSCKKESQRPSAITAIYTGTYYSIGGDTAMVEAYSDTSIASINWLSNGNGAKILFDSVRVLNNATITCNEYVYYCTNQRTVGTGTIGGNQLKFKFTLTGSCGGDVIFNGVK